MLLQAGARPAGSPVAGAVCRRLGCYCPPRNVTVNQLVNPLMQHGLDPLLSAGQEPQQGGNSLLVSCCSGEVCSLMLAHLHAQRAAGSLQLGSKQRCVQLLLGASRCSDPPLPLVQHAVDQLQQLVGSQAAGDEDAAALNRVLAGAVRAGSPAVLSALLASQLPVNVAAALVRPGGCSLLAAAAVSCQPAACVELLRSAGAVPKAADLYCAIDKLLPGGVAALLASGVPAVNTSQPTAYTPLPEGGHSVGWSCPIHRTLHALIDCSRYSGNRVSGTCNTPTSPLGIATGAACMAPVA